MSCRPGSLIRRGLKRRVDCVEAFSLRGEECGAESLKATGRGRDKGSQRRKDRENETGGLEGGDESQRWEWR